MANQDGASPSTPFLPAPLHSRIVGDTEFLDDIEIPGLFHGVFVRLPCARARLDVVDGSHALACDDVVAVFTATDLRAAFGEVPKFGPVSIDQPVLAETETRYQGEPVALIVAKSREAAVRAVDSMTIDFTELAGFVSVAGALSADALHSAGDPAPMLDGAEKNIMGDWRYSWGDVDIAERAAHVVVDNTYSVPFAHHFAIETFGAIGIPAENQMTILSTVQHPFILQRVVATMLGLPLSSVDVRAVDMGGSFGGKAYPKIGPAAAVFSSLLGRPLKIVLSAEESFLTGQREASNIRIRTGFSSDGTITCQRIDADFLIGAYGDISSRVVSKAALHATGPYETPNAQVHARAIYSTTPPTTAFRGFGAPHLAFAIEGQFIQAAQVLGFDECDLRLKNMKNKGDQTVKHETPVDGDWPTLLRMAQKAIGWDQPSKPKHGRGIAFGMKSCVPATTSNALIRVHSDGTVNVFVGTSEMGQGAVLTFASIVAARLGAPLSDVIVNTGDTAVAPFDALTGSSRSLVHMGNALVDASDQILELALLAVKSHHDHTASTVSTDGCALQIGSWTGGLRDLILDEYGPMGGEFVAVGTFSSPRTDGHPLGGPTPFFEAVATAVELSVDEATGMIDLLRVVHVTDAGKIHNASRAKGIDEGGVVMGIGLALSEQLLFDDNGRLLNGSSLDYRIPTLGDIPRHSVSQFQENGDGPGPDGAKGIAEGGVLAVAPAIAAAIHDCTSIELQSLPMTPERLWVALQDQKGSR